MITSFIWALLCIVLMAGLPYINSMLIDFTVLPDLIITGFQYVLVVAAFYFLIRPLLIMFGGDN